jgi:hypothetical protein
VQDRYRDTLSQHWCRLFVLTVFLTCVTNGLGVTVYFVSADGDDAMSGTSWATAKGTVMAAMDVADLSDEICGGPRLLYRTYHHEPGLLFTRILNGFGVDDEAAAPVLSPQPTPYRLRSCPIDLTGPVPGYRAQGTDYLRPGARTVPLSIAGVTYRGPVSGSDVRLEAWIRGR